MLQEHSPKIPHATVRRATILIAAIGAASIVLAMAAGPAVGQSPSVDPARSPEPVGVANPMPSPNASPQAPLCPGELPGRADIIYPSSEPVAVASPRPSPSASASPGISTLPDGSPTPSVPATSALSPSPSPSPSEDPCEPAQIGLGAGPSQLLLGTVRSGSIDIYNAGNIEAVVRVSAFDFVRGPDGSLQVVDEPLPQGAAAWLVFDHTDLILQPGVNTTINFTVEPPLDAPPGDHYASVLVEASMSDETSRLLRPGGKGLQFKSNLRATTTVVTRIEGAIMPLVAVPPFEAFLPSLVTTMSGDFTFTPSIDNTGNVAAVWMPVAGETASLDEMVPTLRLAATGGLLAKSALLVDGERTANGYQLSPLVVLPGATHTQKLTMTDAPLFGSYDYTYTLPASVADGREEITRTGHFLIVNLQKVLLWIVLPLLVLMVLFTFWMIRRQHTSTTRRMAATLRARELQQARAEAYEQALREQQAQGRGPW